MDWKRLLAYISGSAHEELLVHNEYLVTENQILRNQLKGRLRLTDGERKTHFPSRHRTVPSVPAR